MAETERLKDFPAKTTLVGADIIYLGDSQNGSVPYNEVKATLSNVLLYVQNNITISSAALTAGNDTNITLTLGGTPTTALLNAASITAGWTGTLSLARGGSANNLTASAGGIVWSDASKLNILAGTTTAGQLMLSGNAATPSWSTSTYPSTNAVSTLLYASSANVMAALATANNGTLITSGAGVPSISSTLPAAVQGNITALGTIGQNVTISAASSGGNLTLAVQNSSNTSSSGSLIASQVAGSSAGNPSYQSIISGGQIFTWGINQSDSSAWVLAASGSLGTTNAIRVDNSGRLTYANQPRFLAYKSSSTVNALGNTATNYTIPFDSESYDIGSNYNTSTFTFTAPVAGYWNFIISFNMGNLGTAHTAMVFQLWKNGTTGFPIKYGNPGAMRDANNSLIVSGSRSMHLNATDTIQVQMEILNGTQVVTAAGDNVFTTSFAGILAA